MFLSSCTVATSPPTAHSLLISPQPHQHLLVRGGFPFKIKYTHTHILFYIHGRFFGLSYWMLKKLENSCPKRFKCLKMCLIDWIIVPRTLKIFNFKIFFLILDFNFFFLSNTLPYSSPPGRWGRARSTVNTGTAGSARAGEEGAGGKMLPPQGLPSEISFPTTATSTFRDTSGSSGRSGLARCPEQLSTGASITSRSHPGCRRRLSVAP